MVRNTVKEMDNRDVRQFSVENEVKVKNSSPKRLSADCQPTVGWGSCSSFFPKTKRF